MEVVNPFILKNKERMIVFLDQLSSITDPYMPPGGLLDISNNANTASDPGKLKVPDEKYFNFKMFPSTCRTRTCYPASHMHVTPPRAAKHVEDQQFH